MYFPLRPTSSIKPLLYSTFLWLVVSGVSSFSLFPLLSHFPAANLLLSHLQEEDPLLLFAEGLQHLGLHPHVLKNLGQHLGFSWVRETAVSLSVSPSSGSCFSGVVWLFFFPVPESGSLFFGECGIRCGSLQCSLLNGLPQCSRNVPGSFGVKALCPDQLCSEGYCCGFA